MNLVGVRYIWYSWNHADLHFYFTAESLPLSKGSFRSVFKPWPAISSQISYKAALMACFYFVGFILALYPPETLGTNVVSESYEVQAIPVDPSFSSHFAPLQPQQQQQQPTGDEKLLYEQQQYLWQRLLLKSGLLIRTRDRAGKFPVGEIDRPQTAIGVVAK